MVQQVLGGFVRVVVVNRAIVLMVVLDVLVVCQFVRDGGVISSQQRTPLHGEAMQRKAHQQEDTKDSSHRAVL